MLPKSVSNIQLNVVVTEHNIHQVPLYMTEIKIIDVFAVDRWRRTPVTRERSYKKRLAHIHFLSKQNIMTKINHV